MSYVANVPQSLCLPDHVAWVQDSAGLLLINEATQTAERLVGFPAALWDWLALGYGYEKLMMFAAAWFALPPAQVEPALRQQLDTWCEQGFLERSEP